MKSNAWLKSTELDILIQFRLSLHRDRNDTVERMSGFIASILILLFSVHVYSQDQEIRINAPDHDLIDGPHIQWTKKEKLRLYYFMYNTSQNKTKILSRSRNLRQESQFIKGAGRDTCMYFIEREYFPQPTVHDDVEKILVIGDIHGNYNRVKDLLVNAEIINTDLNWTWGKGHLVFLGDIFDRGDDVTSILWLIYSLQQQAKKDGGMVHLLLGNHEIMIMEGDERYISHKYLYLTETLKVSYSMLFGPEYVLGRWLRAQNAVIRINRILFVHGGISPGFIDKELALSDVNDSVRMYLTSPGTCGPDSLQNFLFGTNGPFWYRGYIPAYSGSESISEKSLKELLHFYKAERIIYGHTPGNKFRFGYDNQLIGIDVSANFNPDNEQALLILDGKYYKLFVNGTKMPAF